MSIDRTSHEGMYLVHLYTWLIYILSRNAEITVIQYVVYTYVARAPAMHFQIILYLAAVIFVNLFRDNQSNRCVKIVWIIIFKFKWYSFRLTVYLQYDILFSCISGRNDKLKFSHIYMCKVDPLLLDIFLPKRL